MNFFSKYFKKNNTKLKYKSEFEINQDLSKIKESSILDIKNAITNKDADNLQDVLVKTNEIENDPEFIDLLNLLLLEDWHFNHEDIAQYLQKLKNPKSIDVLHKTIFKKFKYLDYNNSEALARKCVWALADIGNKKAKKILIEVSKTDNDEISNYAQKRIDNWEKEQHRKLKIN